MQYYFTVTILILTGNLATEEEKKKEKADKAETPISKEKQGQKRLAKKPNKKDGKEYDDNFEDPYRAT
jgi:hypothetical protein